MNHQEAVELKQGGTDLGSEARAEGSAPFTLDQRKRIALVLALELSLGQFIKERVFRDHADVQHFLMHFADFAARLMADERILNPDNPLQSSKVESRAGDVAIFAIDEALEKGKIERLPEHEEAELDTMLQEGQAQQAVTNKRKMH